MLQTRALIGFVISYKSIWKPLKDKNSILGLYAGIKAYVDCFDPEMAKHLKIHQPLTSKELLFELNSDFCTGPILLS